MVNELAETLVIEPVEMTVIELAEIEPVEITVRQFAAMKLLDIFLSESEERNICILARAIAYIYNVKETRAHVSV